MNPTKAQIHATVNTVRAVADCIRELKEVPSGVLYAQLMAHMDLHTYEAIIRVLKSAGVVTEENHLLKWKQP